MLFTCMFEPSVKAKKSAEVLIPSPTVGIGPEIKEDLPHCFRKAMRAVKKTKTRQMWVLEPI